MSNIGHMRQIGVFEVTVGQEAVAAFAAALGKTPSAGASGTVPLTFPMFWLSDPGIHEALMPLLRRDATGAERFPVYLEQHIQMHRPLRIGARYLLTLALDGPDSREMVRITLRLSDSEGRLAGVFETGLVLVPARHGEMRWARNR